MSYKERMQTKDPAAELMVLIELQNRQLLPFMDNLGTTILFVKGEASCLEAIFVKKENVTRELLLNVEGLTIPDYPFLRHARLAFYLDGPPHLKKGVMARDERINDMLTQTKVNFDRFPYKPKLSAKRLQEICDKIESEVLN